MPRVKRRDDILEQIKEAFSTIIMDDHFLSSEERQRDLLEHLHRQSERHSRETDRKLTRDAAIAEKIRDEMLDR